MEQSQVDESTVDEGNEGEATGLTPDEMLSEIKKLRKEAASRRVSKKTADAETARKLEEYDAWKKSQMTETQRLQAEKDELAATNRELLREKRQRDIGTAVGLDPDFHELIKGDDEDEMKAHAKRLAAKLGTSKAPSKESLFPGRRGKPVGTETEQDASAAFNNFMRNGGR